MDENEFRQKLSPEQYRILRERGTEKAFTGKYWDSSDHGVYSCAACNQILFTSLDKFDSGTGWPTFHRPVRRRNIAVIDGEILCTKCNSHLGEVLGVSEKYYRVNSQALNFKELPEIELKELEDSEKQDTRDEKKKHLRKVGKASAALGSIFPFGAGALSGASVAVAATLMICGACNVTPAPAAATATSTPLISGKPAESPQAVRPFVTPIVQPATTTRTTTDAPAGGSTGSTAFPAR